MICVTHEMGFAREVADRVIFMDVAQSGRALRSGRRDRVFKSLHPDQEYQALTLDFCKCFFIA